MRITQVSSSRTQIGALQMGIILSGLFTAIIHFYLAAQPDEELRFWFLLNGVGYLSLLGGLFLPKLATQHRLIAFALIAYAALTIILWFILGQPYDTLGIITKSIELALILLLIPESRRRLYHEG